MNLYGVNLKLCATAYIKAESEADALAKAKAMAGKLASADPDDAPQVPFVGKIQFDDPAMPEISLGPAMTIYDPWDDAIELHAEDVPFAASEHERIARNAGYELKENVYVNVGFYYVLIGDRDDAPTTYPTEAQAWEACCRDNELIPTDG